MKLAFDLDDIRVIAENNGYKEISHNKTSRSISFRGGSGYATRINVYYTTGTVGTCLNHPKHGKTQLFRRNLTTLEGLENIFENPRVHTGEGYYTRKSVNQLWKKVGEENQDLRDSARRWLYVASATGLVRNEREMKTIMEICTEWDTLQWNPEDPPDTSRDGTLFSCGSKSGLVIMLEEVMATCGDFHICKRKKVLEFEKGTMSRSEMGTRDRCANDCGLVEDFMEEHWKDVQRLKQKFKSLRKNIRIDLAQWFIGRDSQCRFVDLDFRIFRTNYSDAIESAHIEYGELAYPKKTNMCYHCGVLFNTPCD